ncbi:MAG: acyltransferase family protein [Enterococcus sp.]
MSKQKYRDPFFDNAKFMLMVLVVFGHLLQRFTGDNPLFRNVYYLIFLFHMPAFIAISGYFSKSFVDHGTIYGLIKKLILPYLFFQVIYTIYYTWIGWTSKMNFNFLVPRWALWFLLSMFFWQVSLYLFKRLSALQGISLSLILSLSAGYLPIFGKVLAGQRTMMFLPFFVIGYYLQKEQIQSFKESKWKHLAIVCLPLLYIGVQHTDKLTNAWVFGAAPYVDYLAVPVLGGMVRLLMIGLGLLGIIGFLGLVPKRKMFFTKWGKNTLTVYLLQGFFVKGIRQIPAIANLTLTLPGFLVVILCSLLLTIGLASNSVQKGKEYLLLTIKVGKEKVAALGCLLLGREFHGIDE